MAKIKYGVLLDTGDLDAVFNKLRILRYKNYITYLPTLNGGATEKIIQYLYEHGYEYEKDFTHITNHEGNTLEIRLTKWDKQLIFWSFENATASRWKDWLKIEPQMDKDKFLTIVDRMRAMGFKTMTSSMACWNMWKYGDEDKRIYSQSYSYDRDFPHIENSLALEYIDGSYRGGIIRVQKDYLKKDYKGDFMVYDFNSMYPTMMLQRYPTGFPQFFANRSEAVANGYDLTIHKVWVRRAKIRQGFEPFIQFKTEIAYTYEYPEQFEDAILYLWDIEMEQFEFFYDVEYKSKDDVLGFKSSTGHFNAYINYWKAEKDKSKLENDKVGHMIAKVALNSLYGKFGTKYIHDNIVYTYANGQLKRTYTSKVSTAKYYRPFASFITAKARTKLILQIQNNADKFIYCDTDSIYFKGSRTPDLEIHKSKLGAWKLEGIYKRIIIKAPKYLIKQRTNGDVERVMAGTIEEIANNITFDNILQP